MGGTPTIRLHAELAWVKTNLESDVPTRRSWIEPNHPDFSHIRRHVRQQQPGRHHLARLVADLGDDQP
jgi:hypothetical protein